MATKKRRTLVSILKKTPPKRNESASRYCDRVKYKHDVIWSSGDEDHFTKTLARHGYHVDQFSDRIVRREP